MEFMRRKFRQLRWQLTLSYTAVTVGTLLLVVLIAGGIFLSSILIPLPYLPTKENWVEAAFDGVSTRGYSLLLSAGDPDPETLEYILDRSTSLINSRVLFLFGDIEIYAVSTGNVRFLVFSKDGELLGSQIPQAAPYMRTGKPFDPTLIEGLAGPFEAALRGETEPEQLITEVEPNNKYVIAVPIFHVEDADQVVGVVGIEIGTLSTESDRGQYLFAILSRSFLYILAASVLVSGTFGALSAEGISRRFHRFSEATEAWSKGDFSIHIQDDSGDEIAALGQRLDGMAEDLEDYLHERQQLAISEERNRLARELHDSSKQLALAASFQIGSALELCEQSPEQAYEHIQEAEILVDRVRRELTDLIHELRPPEMEGREFSTIVNDYIVEWAHQNDITADVELGDCPKLTMEARQSLYRILQEALANVARHSRASHVDISIQSQEQHINLSVKDNGIGFDPDLPQKGVGMKSMTERITALEGEIKIISADGQGTEIFIRVPC